MARLRSKVVALRLEKKKGIAVAINLAPTTIFKLFLFLLWNTNCKESPHFFPPQYGTSESHKPTIA